MTKNPFINAASAVVYIILVALFMTYGMEKNTPNDSIFAPIVVLSVFTLSAAVMGYVFFYQPLQLYLDGKKKEGVNLFLQTVGFFAVITTAIAILFFSGIVS